MASVEAVVVELVRDAGDRRTIAGVLGGLSRTSSPPLPTRRRALWVGGGVDPALIARTQDIEHRRMVAQVLMAENRVLYERVSEIRADLAIARGEAKAQLELELKIITERLAVRCAATSSRSRSTTPRSPRSSTSSESSTPSRPSPARHLPKSASSGGSRCATSSPGPSPSASTPG